MSATMMVAAGFYGVAPFVFPGRTRTAVAAMDLKRRDQTNLLQKAGVEAGVIEEVFSELYSLRGAVADLVKLARGNEVAPETPAANDAFKSEDGSVEELFSELFSLRSTVATLGTDLRNLRATIDTPATPARRGRTKTAVAAVPAQPRPRARAPKRAAA
jgi:hypothetical protein